MISDLVRREIRARFASTDADDVACLLEATLLPMLDDASHPREHDRVHLGILKLADGDFERFARALALAATDWRDLLINAGLADDDWREVLRSADFPVP